MQQLLFEFYGISWNSDLNGTVQNGYTIDSTRLGYENAHTRHIVLYVCLWYIGTWNNTLVPLQGGCPFSPSQLRREVLQRNIQTRRWHQKFRMTHFIRVNRPAGVLTEIEVARCEINASICMHVIPCRWGTCSRASPSPHLSWHCSCCTSHTCCRKGIRDGSVTSCK